MMAPTAAAVSWARECELFRYYQPSEHYQASDDETNAKRSSNDPCLTAFAQLGALRLQCRRGVIVLSTVDVEYILAESGQALSLQQDNDENDSLWYGVGLLKREVGRPGLGSCITETFADPQNCPTYFGVGDMTKDERFKDKATVVGAPHLRAMACVPLRSVLNGMVIGAYVVLDDKVREQLSTCDQEFLIDMATTVSDHLESGRLKAVQHRSGRMVKAMGLFIEGKSSLRDWWLEKGHKYQQSAVKKRVKKETPLESQADLEFGVQETVDYFSRHGLSGLHGDYRASMAVSPGSSETQSQSGTEPRGSSTGGTPSHLGVESIAHRPVLLSRDTFSPLSEGTTPVTQNSQTWQHRDSSVTTVDGTLPEPTPDPGKQSAVTFDLPPVAAQQDKSHELQNALLSTDLKSVFARASNLIRECIAVEGVLYLDASVGSFGGSSNRSVMEEKAPGAFHTDNNVTASDEDPEKRSSDIDGETKGTGHVGESETYCNVLGYSTRRNSSLHGHRVSDEHQRFPEAVLRKMLKRYPHGKIFNFDKDGKPSSFESCAAVPRNPDSLMPVGRLPNATARKRSFHEQETDAILTALPGARSVFWFPLWDQNLERWYSGSFVWSTSASRTMCPVEDITYLAAFGNSTMAEVSRLSAQALSRMKIDFISSISHELRSPLHGVLASVEFLQETEMTEQQIEMVDNIHASGNVLLDTINHVLDFSKVNRKIKKKDRKSKKSKRTEGPKEGSNDEAEKADICLVSEEVIDSIYAGQKVSKKAFGTSRHQRQLSNTDGKSHVTVIIDIAWRDNWTFGIDKGAWRRILMNLFSNAMKYTAEGFVKVSLDIEDKSNDVQKKSPQQNLILKVKDSGRGIHEEFLKHQLYKPFTQEDSLASGAGLGLSIVHAIVQELGGKISFTSEPGTGTEATVKIPLVQGELQEVQDARKLVPVIREACAQKSVELLGFDHYPDLEEEPTGILDREAEAAMLLKGSMNTTLKDWFGIGVTTSTLPESSPEILIVMEAGLREKSLAEVLAGQGSSHVASKRIVIVLTGTYHSGPKFDAHERFHIFYMQQPYAPHKLAKILHQAFCSPEGIHDTPTRSRTTSQSTSPNVVGLRSASSHGGFESLDGAVMGAGAGEVAQPLSPRPQLWTPPTERLHDAAPPRPVFTIVEPVTTSPSAAAEITTPPPGDSLRTPPIDASHDSKKAGLKVLLVEDNEINLKLLVATMRKLKLEHSTAMNGLEALNAYKECTGTFDVIFMDISMPIMSGIESTRHIRRYEAEYALAPVAVIALTGAANATTRQEAFSSGVDLFLTKPVPMRALRGMLEELEREGRAMFVG